MFWFISAPEVREREREKKKEEDVLLLKSDFLFAESDECLNFGYSLIRDVLSVVRRTDLGRSLSAHVVQCRSIKDIKPPLVRTTNTFF